MSSLEILLTGDLILDEPDPDHWLSGIAQRTRKADLTIGHLEVPHTHRGQERGDDIPAPAADPAHLSALKRAGFAAVTLAGNHMADQGAEGIEDTIAGLERVGVAHCGAGPSLAQAQRPAVLERCGRRVGVLSFNCVGPQSSWAGPDRAGVAFVRVASADGEPITPSAALACIDPISLANMRAIVEHARSQLDLLIVAFHKGMVHRPAVLAPYERPLSQAAIDAGADVVVGHHAHIIKGIELYRGNPIFHGLGNGCVITRALSPAQRHPQREAWARRRRELFNFEPDPAYELAPFHPEAVHGMMARVTQQGNGTLDVGFVPVHIEAPGRPVLASPEQALRIRDYVAGITIKGGLPPLDLVLSGDTVQVPA